MLKFWMVLPVLILNACASDGRTRATHSHGATPEDVVRSANALGHLVDQQLSQEHTLEAPEQPNPERVRVEAPIQRAQTRQPRSTRRASRNVQRARPVKPVATQRRVRIPRIKCSIQRPRFQPDLMVRIRNHTRHHVALTIDGHPAAIEYVRGRWRHPLSAGVASRFLPPGEDCYYVMIDPRAEQHVVATMWRRNYYARGAHDAYIAHKRAVRRVRLSNNPYTPVITLEQGGWYWK